MLTFVGDSLMDGWRGRRQQRLLASYQQRPCVLTYPGKRPEVITAALEARDLDRVSGPAVLMAGVNSFTLDASPAAIARNVQVLVGVVRQRADRVVLCSILPAILWGRNEWPRIREANAYLAETHDVDWLDLTPSFLGGDQMDPRFTVDGVHLTFAGYRCWAQALSRTLSWPVPHRRLTRWFLPQRT